MREGEARAVMSVVAPMVVASMGMAPMGMALKVWALKVAATKAAWVTVAADVAAMVAAMVLVTDVSARRWYSYQDHHLARRRYKRQVEYLVEMCM